MHLLSRLRSGRVLAGRSLCYLNPQRKTAAVCDPTEDPQILSTGDDRIPFLAPTGARPLTQKGTQNADDGNPITAGLGSGAGLKHEPRPTRVSKVPEREKAFAIASIGNESGEKTQSNRNDLVLDAGFLVPKTNTFGHTFRDYDAESERNKSVEELYRMNHIHQSYEFVTRMRKEYGKLDRVEMSIWECCELLNEFVDESDPDLDEPQIEHLLQTAEAIRKDYPNEDWLHLTGLIHDLGKVLLHPTFGALPQWAVVGDTFPVGCAFDESNVHNKYFKENPDYNNPKFNTKFGLYSQGCGLENVLMSWGHDDYMYLVAKENKTTLPQAGLFIIRYHSFYPLHKAGAYTHLLNEEDVENLKWLHIFNKYDLYTKSKVRVDVDKVKPYYLSLIEKYFPSKLRW